MKFKNCIFVNFVTDARTEGRTDKPKAIHACPFNFSKVGVIKTSNSENLVSFFFFFFFFV